MFQTACLNVSDGLYCWYGLSLIGFEFTEFLDIPIL